MGKRRKDGLLQKRVTINGKLEPFYGKTEKEIKQKIEVFKEKIKNGPLFKEVAENWKEEHFKQLEVNSLRNYNPAYNRAVDEFGDHYINTIKASNINAFISIFAKKGFAQKTVRTQLMILNMIFDRAVLDGLIEYNPCSSVKIPKNLAKNRRELPPDGETDIVKKSTDKPFGLFAYFILYTGCRRGEALALTYKDIDRKNKTITINKSVYQENNKPMIKNPKTKAGCREIVLLDILAKQIPKRKSSDLIFPNDFNALMSETQFQRKWELYCKATGITSTPHRLRHAYATMIFEAGIDVKDAQELLGHSNLSTTMDIYTHITNKRKSETAKILNKKIS